MRPVTSPGSGRWTPTIPVPSPTPCRRGPTPGGVSHSPTHMAALSRTDAPAPDRHRVSAVLSGPPDHQVLRRPASATDRRAAQVTDQPAASTTDHPTAPMTAQQAARTTDRRTASTSDRRTVHVTDRELARPARLRPAHPARPGPSASRSWRAATVTMPGRRPRTGPPPGCATSSRSGMPPAPIPVADGPPCAATPTTPWPTTVAAERACATSRRCAGITTRSNSHRDGPWSKRAQASWSGPRRPAAGTSSALRPMRASAVSYNVRPLGERVGDPPMWLPALEPEPEFRRRARCGRSCRCTLASLGCGGHVSMMSPPTVSRSTIAAHNYRTRVQGGLPRISWTSVRARLPRPWRAERRKRQAAQLRQRSRRRRAGRRLCPRAISAQWRASR